MDELEKRAKKHRKKQDGMSPFTTLDSGDPKANADAFNHAMGADSAGASGGACEELSITQAMKMLDDLDSDGISEDVYLKENALRILDEANLNRIAKGHDKDGYAILSASRAQNSEERNNFLTNQLRKALRDKRYSYISVYGGYKEYGQPKASLEKSFVVFPYDMQNHKKLDFETFKNDMINLATPSLRDKSLSSDEDQDSILICEPGGKPHYINLKDDTDLDDLEFNSVEFNNTDNEFFTAIKKWNDSSLNRKGHNWDNGKPQRYTLKTECYIDDAPTSMQMGHSRWASGDLNHIYKEDVLNETSAKTKAKKLFSEPGKMSYIKTFAIFTSYNPDKKSFPKKDNTAFMKKLKADASFDADRYIGNNSQYFSADDIERAVRNGHWHYYRVKGVYDNVEHSLLVYNITLGDAKELSAKYHQQSFIFGTNTDGVLKFEFWANESKKGYSYRKVDERDNFELLDADADNYYTQISRDFKFNIPFEVFEVAADEMVESINKKNERLNWTEEAIMECIEESVNEEITGKYRYYARSTLWNR